MNPFVKFDGLDRIVEFYILLKKSWVPSVWLVAEELDILNN